MAVPPDKVVSGCVWDELNPLYISGPGQGTPDIRFFFFSLLGACLDSEAFVHAQRNQNPDPNLCNYLKTFFFFFWRERKKNKIIQFPSKFGDFLACNLLKQQHFSLPQ